MKRVFVATIFAMVTFAVSAQSSTQTATASATDATTVTSIPKTDRLAPFSGVKVDGPMNVVFKSVPTADDVRITYDTKGNVTSKFKFEIDKNGLLTVSEKSDPKRTSVTDITIYYHTLKEVRIAHAKAEFEGTIDSDILDVVVSGGATVSLDIKTLDVAVECTGVSRLTLSGSTKYLTMRASTAKLDCSNLSIVSATIDASHSADVRIYVQERLEVTTSTGAKLLYKGTPIILREHNVIFGGEVININ
jgi:hypothetical protein